MGRRQLTLHEHCKGSHFNWGERLMLQYYYTGWNGYRKERSPTVLGKIFQKSPKTISRELRRGMVEHLQDDPPFIRIEYNAEHAQLDADRGEDEVQGAGSQVGQALQTGGQDCFSDPRAPLQPVCGGATTGVGRALAGRSDDLREDAVQLDRGGRHPGGDEGEPAQERETEAVIWRQGKEKAFPRGVCLPFHREPAEGSPWQA